MKIVKCKCGWKGNKYHVLVGIVGYTCPKCDSVIPDEDVTGKSKVSNSTPLNSSKSSSLKSQSKP